MSCVLTSSLNLATVIGSRGIPSWRRLHAVSHSQSPGAMTLCPKRGFEFLKSER